MTKWQYIQVNRRYRTSEPDGLPPERSSIWNMVLQEIWKEGLSRGAIAAKLLMPEEELESLLFGLAGAPAPPARRPPDLKAVSRAGGSPAGVRMGRAACGDRVCQSVAYSAGTVHDKKKE